MNARTSLGGGCGGGPRPAGSGPIAEAVRIWNDLPEWARTGAKRDRLMQLWVQAEALRLTNVRAGQARKAGNPGPESSISKLMLALVNRSEARRVGKECVSTCRTRGSPDQ